MESLILVDVLDAHGTLVSRQRLPLASGGPPIVIGRDIGCDVIIDDPYVAPRHAALALHEDGSVRITDLSSHNGLIVRGERLRGVSAMPLPEGVVRLGHSTLRIRSAIEPVAPEMPDRESLRARHREYAIAAAGALACLAFALFTAWVGSPDDVLPAIAASVLPGALVLGALIAFWTLLSRTHRSRGRFSTQAAIVLAAAAAVLWLDWAADVAVFASGIRSLYLAGRAVQLGIIIGAVLLHLRTVSWMPRTQAVLIAIALPVAVAAGYAGFVQRQRAQDVNDMPAFRRMFPPAWSQQYGVRLDAFIDESLGLRDAADARRAQALE
jgi:hypothetical protein